MYVYYTTSWIQKKFANIFLIDLLAKVNIAALNINVNNIFNISFALPDPSRNK